MFDLEKEKKRIISLMIALQSMVVERKVSDPLEEFFFKACSKTMKECVFGLEQSIELYEEKKHLREVITAIMRYYNDKVSIPLVDHLKKMKGLNKRDVAKQLHPKAIIFVI